MEKFKLFTDGSADLPEEVFTEHNIGVIPFYITLDNNTYKTQGVDISSTELYDWMINHTGKFPKSSTPSPGDFYDNFKSAAEKGCDILCICISSLFSGSFQSATLAKNMIEDEFENINIIIMDSRVNTVLQGLIVIEACRLRDAGTSLVDSFEKLEEIKKSARIFFTIGGIEYLQIGGRIGKLAGKIGSLIGIRPIITLKDGEIYPSGISRRRNKSLDKVITLVEEYIPMIASKVEEFSLSIGYGYDVKEAQEFRVQVKEMLSRLGMTMDISLVQIGAVIGVHTGPQPLGIGLVKRVVI